ncbi:hypothetical protein PM082_019668 [Marasmius tenuissimus]|nr:hypothetical protein PM082_019668 [Marasmius tenuissimus]
MKDVVALSIATALADETDVWSLRDSEVPSIVVALAIPEMPYLPPPARETCLKEFDLSKPPATLQEALLHPDSARWSDAMKREITSLTDMNVFIDMDSVPKG